MTHLEETELHVSIFLRWLKSDFSCVENVSIFDIVSYTVEWIASGAHTASSCLPLSRNTTSNVFPNAFNSTFSFFSSSSLLPAPWLRDEEKLCHFEHWKLILNPHHQNKLTFSPTYCLCVYFCFSHFLSFRSPHRYRYQSDAALKLFVLHPNILFVNLFLFSFLFAAARV